MSVAHAALNDAVLPIPHIIWPLALVALLLAVWMVVIERRRFRVRRVILDADAVGLPESKILHLTDTHFHGRNTAMLSFLRRLSAREEFDLVFLTGDLIESGRGIRSAAEAASFFRPRIGSFAVLGGHDHGRHGILSSYTHLLCKHRAERTYRKNPVEALMDALEKEGVHVLQDAHARVAAPDGRRFAVVGLRDAFQFEPDFAAAWDGLPDDVPVIVIAHSPDVLAEVGARRPKLAFFGHTHGGQVRLPLIGAIVTRCKLPRRLASGTFRHDSTIFTVSSGLGTVLGAPYRLLCRPEVTVLELRCYAAPGALTPVKEARL